MIAYSRGSQCLVGAASLKNRMPAMVGPKHPIGYSSMGRATACKAVVVGSNPAFRPSDKTVNTRVNRASLPPRS
jgi:hypothetical protein